MATSALGRTNQYLTFKLGPEVYALDVASARQIVEFTLITQIPGTPPWVRGVINLRGTVVPVLDLKMKFDLGTTERTVNTCVIIVEFTVDDEVFVVGMLTDSVQEVFELDAGQIEPPPKFGTRVSTEYVRGMGRRDDNLFIILDPQRIFAAGELVRTKQAAEGAAAQTAGTTDAATTQNP